MTDEKPPRSPAKPTIPWYRRRWVVFTLCLAGFGAVACVLVGVAAIWLVLFYSPETRDIADYDATIATWREFAPELVEHFPPQVPQSAIDSRFYCIFGAQQGADEIYFYTKLSADDYVAAAKAHSNAVPVADVASDILWPSYTHGIGLATTVDAPGCLVSLTHSGWDVAGTWLNPATYEVVYFAFND